MVRVAIHSPGAQAGETVEIAEGEGLLIGRHPNVARAELPSDVAAETVRVAKLESPSVSANHALVTQHENGIAVADLGSRNGTWMRLPAGTSVKVERGDAVSLHLALEPSERSSDAMPADAQWTGRDDFAEGVARAVDAWLARRSLSAATRIVPRVDGYGERMGRIPLPVNVDLRIESMGTMESGFVDRLLEIERYVARQNVLFAGEEEMRENGMIIASSGMRRALARVIDAAERGVTSVLITGPSGAGKDGLARCFHRHTRRAGPFVARNCALFNKDLVRSELFGAEKGSFSGCTQRITGAVEAAHNGTLFLDELAELPREVQPMLLQFLDRGEFERIGRYGRPCTSDARIVGATNADLRTRANRDEFRLDLWYRLAVCVIEVPPLRDRFADIEAYLRTRVLPLGGSLYEALAPEAIELLREHRWDGNFRELVNFASRVMQHASNNRLDAMRCRAALAEGSLFPPDAPALRGAPSEKQDDAGDAWRAVFDTAVAAFTEDHEGPMPETWDEVKDFVENYVKPVMFAHLTEVSDAAHAGQVDLRIASQRMQADRGTAVRQLERYFDRFAGTRKRL